MRANVGDRIVVRGHHVGDPDHAGEVVEVRGKDGGPPYVVRWTDSGHETLPVPGLGRPDRTHRASAAWLSSPAHGTGRGRHIGIADRDHEVAASS